MLWMTIQKSNDPVVDIKVSPHLIKEIRWPVALQKPVKGARNDHSQLFQWVIQWLRNKPPETRNPATCKRNNAKHGCGAPPRPLSVRPEGSYAPVTDTHKQIWVRTQMKGLSLPPSTWNEKCVENKMTMGLHGHVCEIFQVDLEPCLDKFDCFIETSTLFGF